MNSCHVNSSASNLFAHISVQYIHFFSILHAISVFYNELYIMCMYLYSNFRINTDKSVYLEAMQFYVVIYETQ